MHVPPILDVEASGFGRGSYPVEVGYVLDDGDSQCMLVRPASDWNHWSPAAERLQKEQVATALGLPRHRACADARLLQATFGKLRDRGHGHVDHDRTPSRATR
jgi:hypothetical protein